MRKGKASSSRGRPKRTFALGPPGAILRVDYPLQRKGNALTSWIVAVALVAGGVVGVASTQGLRALIGIAAILGGIYVGGSALRRRRGVVVLDEARLQIGPAHRAHDVPLDAVVGTGRGLVSAVSGAAAAQEDLVVRYAAGDTPGKIEMAAALLPRPVADELDRRIGIRARAARIGHPRAVEAAEARWLAGADVIGVVHGDDGWRPVLDTADLEKVAAHPFRGEARKLLVCVTPAVWSAIQSVPDLADRIEPLVVPD